MGIMELDRSLVSLTLELVRGNGNLTNINSSNCHTFITHLQIGVFQNISVFIMKQHKALVEKKSSSVV